MLSFLSHAPQATSHDLVIGPRLVHDSCHLALCPGAGAVPLRATPSAWQPSRTVAAVKTRSAALTDEPSRIAPSPHPLPPPEQVGRAECFAPFSSSSALSPRPRAKPRALAARPASRPGGPGGPGPPERCGPCGSKAPGTSGQEWQQRWGRGGRGPRWAIYCSPEHHSGPDAKTRRRSPPAHRPRRRVRFVPVAYF